MTTNLPIAIEILPMVLQLQPAIAMTEDQLYEFCQLNRDFRIERNATGELVIMSPTGAETDQLNFDIIVQYEFPEFHNNCRRGARACASTG